jgi:FtsZ-interacting cell division protein ZipA
LFSLDLERVAIIVLSVTIVVLLVAGLLVYQKKTQKQLSQESLTEQFSELVKKT